MAVLPLELAEAPAMQANLLHCSISIACADEEELHMCSTSRTLHMHILHAFNYQCT